MISCQLALGIPPKQGFFTNSEDLAILKAFSERDRDFEDLVQILRVQEDTLDMDYIEQWTRLLDAGIESDEVTERMDRAVALARSRG